MPVRVTIPIRLRVDPGALTERQVDVEEALAAAVGRALVNSRDVVLEPRGGYVGVRVHPPDVRWYGNALDHLNGSIRAAIEAQIQEVIAEAIQNARLLTSACTNETAIEVRPSEIRESVASERYTDDEAEYELPSYQDATQTQLPIIRTSGRRHPWQIRASVRFQVRVRDYLLFLETLDPEARRFQNIYLMQLDETKRAIALLVQVNEGFYVEVLAEHLFDEAVRQTHVREDEELFYGYSTDENARQQLIAIDLDHVLQQRLPELRGLNSYRVEGTGSNAYLFRGGWLLFVGVVLPQVNLSRQVAQKELVEIPLRVRDLDFLVNDALFEQLFHAPWSNYLSEFGDEPASVYLDPFSPQQQVHYQTLRQLFNEAIQHRVSSEAAFFGGLYLLNQRRLDSVPEAVRSVARERTDEISLSLSEESRLGNWEPDWSGAFIYTVLQPTAAQIDAARFRPEARRQFERLVPLMRERMWRLHERLPFERFIRAYQGSPTPFEFLLEELQQREGGRWFNRLFAASEENHNFEIQHLLIQLSRATRFANEPRVQQAITVINRWHQEGLRHQYLVDRQQVILKAPLGDSRVSVNEVLAGHDSTYRIDRDVQQLKSDRRQALEEAAQTEAVDLIRRIASGEDSRTYTHDQFSQTVIEVAAKRILTQEDFETITIIRSILLLSLENRVEDDVERVYITFQYVERLSSDHEWHIVADSQRTVSDNEFDEQLFWWEYDKAARGAQILAIGVSVFAVIIVAWEVGAIALLVEIAGGAGVVLTSIAISELFYVIFNYRNLTPEGFLLAAVEGYLFALGFRAAGGIMRAAGTQRFIAATLRLTLPARLGTESVRLAWGGWIIERLGIGILGGGSTGFAHVFVHDLVNVMSGRGGWSSPAQYGTAIGLGSFFGILFEFGAAALEPIVMRGMNVVAGAVDRQLAASIREAANLLAENQILPERWILSSIRALATMRQRLSGLIQSTEFVTQFEGGFRSRVSQIYQAMRGGVRSSVYSRLLRLTEVELSGSASQGLERFVVATEAVGMSEEATLAVLDRALGSASQATRFLESLNRLDNTMVRQLAESNHFPAFLDVLERVDSRFFQTLLDQQQFMQLLQSPNLLQLVRNEGGANLQRLLEGPFRIRRVPGALDYQISVQEAEAFLAQVSRQPTEQQRLLMDVALGRHSGRPAGEPLLPPTQSFSAASQEAFALRTQAVSLERQGVELQQRAEARLNDAILAQRSGARRGRVDTILNEAVELERQAQAQLAQARSLRSRADGIEAETTPGLFSQADVDAFEPRVERYHPDPEVYPNRFEISPFSEIQSRLLREMRQIFQGRSGGRVVFRVDDVGTSNFMRIDASGNLTIDFATVALERNYLHLNFGSFERALEFLGRRDLSQGARIVVFEVQESWVSSIRSAAIPEGAARSVDPLLSRQPQLVDVTYAHEQLAVPRQQLDALNQAIIPRSGRVLEISRGTDGMMHVRDPLGQFNVRFPGRIAGDRVVVEGAVEFNPPE